MSAGRFSVDLIGLIIQLSDLLIYFTLYVSQIHLFLKHIRWLHRREYNSLFYFHLPNESRFIGMIKFGFLAKLVL